MKTLWDRSTRQALQTRFGTIEAGARPSWGKMSAPEMVSHVAESLRMAIGELPCAPKNGPLRRWPLKQLVIYWLPWPKGVPTAPELLARRPMSWRGDLGELAGLIERVGSRGADGPFADHPAFGRLTGRAWGVLIHRHLDHHLRQFNA